MVLDLDGEVIAKKVSLIYSKYAMAAVIVRVWLARIRISNTVFEGHMVEGGEAKLVTWTPAWVRVRAVLTCVSRLVT